MEEKAWRVKLYQLNEQEDWDDKGVGKLLCPEAPKELVLKVISERQPNLVLLEWKVGQEAYTIQQETLIVWVDSKTEINMALSFQDPAGCRQVWERIRRFQKLMNAEDQTFELPTPNLNNLDRIIQIMTSPNHPSKADELTNALTRDDNAYLKQLFELQSQCEDLDDLKSLGKIFTIFKNLVLLNDTTLIEIFLSDEYFDKVLGAFVVDPDVGKKFDHREYVKNFVTFKEIIPFSQPEPLVKIHQTFRMQYLKDSILARHLDDPTYSTLNSWVTFNNVEVACWVQTDTNFLQQLFTKLMSTTNETEYRDLIALLQELCNISKSLQLVNRSSFFKLLATHGLLKVIEKSLVDENRSIRLTSVNILETFVSSDAELARQEITSQKPCQLFNQILKTLLTDPDSGIRVQLVDIVKILIDFGEGSTNKEDFLNLFYQDFLPRLVEPFAPGAVVNKDEYGSVKESVCDLLSYCVQHHGIRIKFFVLGNNVVSKVLTLLKRREKYLILAGVRFFRALIAAKDEFYNKHIVKYNLFQPIIEVFVKNKDKYNLLNSTLIEIFDFILKQNIKTLILHLVENYRTVFQDITYVDTFKTLILKYEQYINNQNNSNDNNPPTIEKTASLETQIDEPYFKESEDEESPALLGNPSEDEERAFKPLVVYKEEDELPKSLNRKRKINFSSNLTLSKPENHISSNLAEDLTEPISKRPKSGGEENDSNGPQILAQQNNQHSPIVSSNPPPIVQTSK